MALVHQARGLVALVLLPLARELGHVEDRQLGVGRDVLAQVGVGSRPDQRQRAHGADPVPASKRLEGLVDDLPLGRKSRAPDHASRQGQQRSLSHQRLLQVERRRLYD